MEFQDVVQAPALAGRAQIRILVLVIADSHSDSSRSPPVDSRL
jgi:hypothetical protein